MGASYNKELFLKAERIARQAGLKTEVELTSFMAFLDKVEIVRVEDEEEDASGEAPDEFLGENTSYIHIKAWLKCGDRSSHLYPYGGSGHPTEGQTAHRPF